MLSLLAEFFKKRHMLKKVVIASALSSSFCEPVFIVLMDRLEDEGITERVLGILLVFVLLKIFQIIKANIVDEYLLIDLASYLRSKYCASMIKRFKKCEEGMESFFSKYIDKMSDFYVGRINLIIAMASFILINGTLLISGRYVTILVIFLGVLGLMFFSIITRKAKAKYSDYINTNLDVVAFQNNLIDNFMIVQNENASGFLIETLEKKMHAEENSLASNLDNHMHSKKLNEINYILSNILLPVISVVLVQLKMEKPFFLPTIILLSPKITEMVGLLTNQILLERETKAIFDIYTKEEQSTRTDNHSWKIINKSNRQKEIEFYISWLKKRISVSIQENGLYCITGKSGAGKTSLLQMIAECVGTTEMVKASDVLYLGINGFSLEERAFENVKIVAEKDINEVAEVVDDFSKQLDVEMKMLLKEKKYADLSDGQKKLVTVFFALCTNAKMILIDEPTANLDLNSRFAVATILTEMAKNRIVIVTTHDNELIKYADRIYSLE